MQKEIDALGLPVDVQIHGVNAIGHERSNASACQGKDLPWLQEVPASPVWTSWTVTYRDVIVLDGDNEPVAIYNLTDNDLGNAGKYAALKEMLVGFAQGN